MMQRIFIIFILLTQIYSKTLTQHEADKFKRALKIWKIKIHEFIHVEPAPKVIFVGNSPSYIYYETSDEINFIDNPNSFSIPISGRWSRDFALPLYSSERISLVKNYCKNFIDPMNLFPYFYSGATQSIFIVDFSLSGDSVNRFRKLLLTCRRISRGGVFEDLLDNKVSDATVDKSSDAYDIESKGLEFVLLSISSPMYLRESIDEWGKEYLGESSYAFFKKSQKILNGFKAVHDLLTDEDGEALDFALDQMRRAGDDEAGEKYIDRLYPNYSFENWSTDLVIDQEELIQKVTELLTPNKPLETSVADSRKRRRSLMKF